MHKRAALELDKVTAERLQNDPRGASLLKSRAKRASLPLERTKKKTSGAPSQPNVLCIRPASEVASGPQAIMRSMLRPFIPQSWRRCLLAARRPVPSGLGYKAQGLVDANGAVPPPARSVVPAIHQNNPGSSVAGHRVPMRQSTSCSQEPPIRVRRASQPSPRRPPSRLSRSGCRSSSS